MEIVPIVGGARTFPEWVGRRRLDNFKAKQIINVKYVEMN